MIIKQIQWLIDLEQFSIQCRKTKTKQKSCFQLIVKSYQAGTLLVVLVLTMLWDRLSSLMGK